MENPAGAPASPLADTPLTPEQLGVVEAPIDEALAVLAAAGTGKTTTMVARTRFLLSKGVPAEQLLVLTFSRKAAGEFRARLPPEAQEAAVSTFHAWAWQLLRRHWAEAGFPRRPAVLLPEQELGIMRDCLAWERLAALQAAASAWLFLPPSTPWPHIVRTAAERHGQLFQRRLRCAVQLYNSDRGGQALPLEQAADASFADLPFRLQQLLVAELHDALSHSVGSRGQPAGGGSAMEMLLAAEQEADACLQWTEAEKRGGRLPDAAAYAALSAGAGLCRDPELAERQRLAARVGAAFQLELRRQGLAALADLPLLARSLLERGGDALAWARDRWRYVLVDEFQDCSSTMLDLLALLLGERRTVTCVGDDDQQIYGFLAAAPAIFADFRRRFGGRTLCLQLNFRSTAAICAFGGALLHGNQREAQKSMVPARGGACSPVHVRQFHSARAEAEAVAAEVARLWREERVPHSSVAVLLRCMRLRGGEPHAPLKAALERRGIPYVVASQARLGEDPGVAALAAYLAASLEVDPAFEAVLALPLHGLGHDVRSAVVQQQHAARLAGLPPPSLLACADAVCTQAEAAASQAEQHPASQASTSQQALPATELNSDDVAELGRVVGLLRRLRRELGRQPLPEAVRLALRESGLADYLCERAAGAAVEAGGSQAEAQLPAPLPAVLLRAQRVMEEWRAQQQQQQQEPREEPPDEDDWLGGGAPESGAAGAGRQDEGEALVLELLSQLAQDPAEEGGNMSQQQQSAADSDGEGGGGGSGPGVLTLSTIHSAKGLEWPVVFMPGVCEGVLPLRFRPPRDFFAGSDAGDARLAGSRLQHLEEERRLFHVAATRARDALHVSYVQPAAGGPCQGREEELAAAPEPACAPADLPLCSSILAGALERLHGRRDVVQLEGRLPQEDFPGLCCWEGKGSGVRGAALADASNACTGAQQQQQPALAAQPAQLSLAERCRLKMAARQQGGRGSGRKAKRARQRAPAAALPSG